MDHPALGTRVANRWGLAVAWPAGIASGDGSIRLSNPSAKTQVTFSKFALMLLRTETIWFRGLQEAQLLALTGMAIAVVWVWAATRVHVRAHAR